MCRGGLIRRIALILLAFLVGFTFGAGRAAFSGVTSTILSIACARARSCCRSSSDISVMALVCSIDISRGKKCRPIFRNAAGSSFANILIEIAPDLSNSVR